MRIFDRHPLTTDIETITGDMTHTQDINRALNGITTVLHCLSTTVPKTANDNIAFDIDSNLKGTVQLLDAMANANIKEIVFCSSGGTIYGPSRCADELQATHPICSYGIVKLAIEKYIQMHHAVNGLRYQILRISNPYGPGQNPLSLQGVITAFTKRALNNQAITVFGDGEITRDYLYIDDLSTLICQLLQHECWNETINVGSGVPTSLNDIVAALKKIHPQELILDHQPQRNFDLPYAVLNIDKLKRLIRTDIRPLAMGLQQTYDALKKGKSS